MSHYLKIKPGIFFICECEMFIIYGETIFSHELVFTPKPYSIQEETKNATKKKRIHSPNYQPQGRIAEAQYVGFRRDAFSGAIFLLRREILLSVISIVLLSLTNLLLEIRIKRSASCFCLSIDRISTLGTVLLSFDLGRVRAELRRDSLSHVDVDQYKLKTEAARTNEIRESDKCHMK